MADPVSTAPGSHPSQALAVYRRWVALLAAVAVLSICKPWGRTRWGRLAARIRPDARTVVSATTATGHPIGDPEDGDVLDVAGLDAWLPMAVGGSLRS
ncbi:hypothetical protein [Nonomuraea sp. NPDC003804]|uniref:hypothetical protein n=1 Tax=Nonomuraea sp. NPDC003804 TaxID=3154547 RepID=UPI0033B1582E